MNTSPSNANHQEIQTPRIMLILYPIAGPAHIETHRMESFDMVLRVPSLHASSRQPFWDIQEARGALVLVAWGVFFFFFLCVRWHVD
ncbi:hypothetical protein SODALDRAFT_329492 [Sodiomyces alkalinus F11]|uniref:Uncharacterized protein n=1 Tax=Sodiomyces alkalinus (strain CBS 110278 / VKM F-3762 / F11) TaxID=1314773 RepID=A0A3N2PJC2_SODAK|nr:hypothetical protein SODALDRAFT_329492 [Sodiomyces alkalinus F11]ROT34627.1 hypothetical protein SODALDRAFT_329492 [Sodiomyces alkalinus F11]